MQLSRIKRMSEKRKGAWLDAIDELEQDYKEDKRSVKDCPLCNVPEDCLGCLWVIIEGCGCGAYHWDNHVGVPKRWRRYYRKWVSLRLKMLKRWKRIIKEGKYEI